MRTPTVKTTRTRLAMTIATMMTTAATTVAVTKATWCSQRAGCLTPCSSQWPRCWSHHQQRRLQSCQQQLCPWSRSRYEVYAALLSVTVIPVTLRLAQLSGAGCAQREPPSHPRPCAFARRLVEYRAALSPKIGVLFIIIKKMSADLLVFAEIFTVVLVGFALAFVGVFQLLTGTLRVNEEYYLDDAVQARLLVVGAVGAGRRGG